MEYLITFTRDFDYREGSFTIAYKKGMTVEVSARCAEHCLDKGAAVQADEDPLFDPDLTDPEDLEDLDEDDQD